jgi:VCBS repeat-containing protein
MTTKIRFQFLSIITILSMLITIPQPALAAGATINVPGDYATIQAAINAASSGDIINILAGTYVENIVVDKPLTIMGAGQGNTIIQPAVSNANPCTGSSLCGGTASNVFLVQANNVVIHDLTVDGDNPTLTSGIVRTGGGSAADLDARNGIIKNTNAVYNGLDVYNVTVQNIYLRGIYSTNGAFNFHHNTVTNVQGDGYSIAMFAWGGPGIMANNTVSYANDGISANHSNGIQFLHNTVTHSGSGIHTDNSGDAGGVADMIQGNHVDCTDTPGAYGVWVFVPYIAPTFNDNMVTNCDIGISAWGTGAAVTTQFTHNTVTGNLAVGAVGVYITTSLAGYGYGDVLVNFSDNVITNYETGVYLTADETAWDPDPFVEKSITATFHENQIFGNTNGVDKGTSGTIVNDFANNWWGSATGPSSTGNPSGTGDTVTSGINFLPWCSNTACASEPPVLPASFYGEIHISDGAPNAGDLVEAYLPGVTGVAASGTITTYLGKLVYSFDIPGTADTEGDLITFKINERVVATGVWHSGTHVILNIHPPEALSGGPYTGNEGSAIAFNGSANDWGTDVSTYEWDWDGNSTYDETGQTVNHTWTQDGTYTVGLKVTDAQGGVDTATVDVTVTNVTPTVNAGADFSIAEDASFNFAGTATDPGADTLTYEWDFDYDNVTFNVDSSGSLTPSHTYAVVGAYTAALRVSDDDTTVIDTVVVTVTNVNDAPVITGQDPLATNEDVALTITVDDLTIIDPDNTVFTLTVLPGTNYTIADTTIMPDADFNGVLTVPVKVNDGTADSNTFDLTVTVNAVNDTPVANPQVLTTEEDTPLPITLTGSDVETVSLTYAITVEPEHGDLSGTIPNLIYTPDVNYNGADSFKFTASDGLLTSAEATITITVGGVNDVPVANDQNVTTDEDTPKSITLTATDQENDLLSYTVLSVPAHGTLSGTAPDLTYTPEANYFGPDAFTFKVNDGQADSNIATISITVNAVNDAPVAGNDTATTAEDTPVVIAVLANDADVESATLTPSIVSDVTHGTLVLNLDKTFTYTPAANFHGTDTFTYKVNDGSLDSNEATVTITVTAVNDVPVITAQSVLSVNEDTSLTINFADLTVTDADNTYPTGFTLTVLDGANYNHVGNVITPAQNFHGALAVLVQVNDGTTNSNTFNLAVTVIDVLPTNPSVGGPYTAASGQLVTLTGSATCETADECAFAWDLDNDGAYDDAVGSSTTRTWYTVGVYPIAMKVTDNDGNFVTATTSVTITPLTHSITLVPGWNLVSFNVHPTSTAIANVLASIEGSYDLVYAWDGTGAHSSSGNWLKYDNIVYSPDTLATLDEGMGFWIHMTAANVLVVSGSIPTTTNITLSDNAGGWNLVGFPSAANGTLPAILSNNGVGTDFTLIYAYHAEEAGGDPWKLYDLTNPYPTLNEMSALTAGWGYWIKVTGDHTWTVQYVAP